jgi:hypothetical protein
MALIVNHQVRGPRLRRGAANAPLADQDAPVLPGPALRLHLEFVDGAGAVDRVLATTMPFLLFGLFKRVRRFPLAFEIVRVICLQLLRLAKRGL